MKRFSFLIVMITVIISCNTKQTKKKVSAADTTAVVILADTANIKRDTRYFWTSDWDLKKGLIMKKTTPLSEDSLTPTNMIQKLNDLYPEIQLRFTKISNDSIFVHINKSNYLTRQIGSSGAQAYLAEVTYNLTELKDINFVDISFKEGDHATPGTFTRTDFIRVKN